MGREVRRVPPDWKHPTNEHGHHQPMHDQSFAERYAEWQEGKRKWDAGEDPDREAHKHKDGQDYTWEEWNGDAPDRAYHRPDWKPEEMTAFQAYETTSEGTPISPVFATREEMIDWCVNDGTDLGWGGTKSPLSREAAEKFVGGAYVPTMISRGNGMEPGIAILETPLPPASGSK